MRLSVCLSLCLSVCLSHVICECENWVLCCAALGEVKLHSGTSMSATKLHSSNWIAVFYNQALVIPTPLERLYELPLSLPWYAKPYPAKKKHNKRHKTHLHENTEGIRDSPVSKRRGFPRISGPCILFLNEDFLFSFMFCVRLPAPSLLWLETSAYVKLLL